MMPENIRESVVQSRELVFRELGKLFAELEASVERADLIAEIDRAILRSTFSPKEVFDLIVQKCLSKTGCRHGQVVRYRRNRLTVASCSDPTRIGQELPLANSLCGLAIRTKQTQHCADVTQLAPGSYVRFHDDTASELVVLIKPEHSSRILGVVDLERQEVGEFDASARAFADLVARQAAITIEHTETWSGVKMLYEISTSLLSGKLKLEETYQTILDSILEGLDYEHGQILRLRDQEFVILASSRKSDIGLRPGKDNSVCGRYLIVEEGREILVVDDLGNSVYRNYYLGLLHAESGEPMRSEMIVPLIENDRLIGALNIESTQVGVFSDLEKSLLGVVCSLMASAISATFARRQRLNRARTEAANVALTQLGTVAQSFLHRFANNIGDARGKLLELKEVLPSGALPALRGGSIPATSFISDITDKLSQAGEAIDEFSDRFNPTHPRFQLKELDFEDVAKCAFEAARKRYSDQTIIFEFESQLPSAGSRTPEDVRSQPVCLLSEEIYEVIENLLNNSVQAILARATGFNEGVICMVLDLPDPFHARLRIEDNGVGIPEPNRSRIFEFGFTTKKHRPFGGGLGLWFCDLYVRQRGGDIDFVPRSGGGSIFQVTLPTVLAAADE
jgi:signal transduction histidine kinase